MSYWVGAFDKYKENMKVFWRRIHLWLGLVAGIIFFVECVTGTILVFEDEITELMHLDRYFVKEVKEKTLPLDQILDVVQDKITSKEAVKSVKIFADTRKTMLVNLSSPQRKNKENGHSGQIDKATKDQRQLKRKRTAGDILYVDPYTAEIRDRVNPADPTFFKFILKVHQSLALGDIGKSVLGISTFVVMIILLTGIILWWPKTKKILKNRLKVKTGASWKRINHDLHVVLGFYCSFFLLIILITSLPWSFKWANEALYTLTNSKPKKTKEIQIASKDDVPLIGWQKLLDVGKSTLPEAPYWSFGISTEHEGKAFNISTVNTKVLHRNGFDQVSVDPYTGKVIQISWHDESPGGWQMRRYLKPIHTGAIGGIPTKIVAFVVCLLSASFPITGIILWINRMKKKRKKTKKRSLNLELV